MTVEEEPRKYRPVALWFMLIVGAVVALAILGDWLRKRYG
jgi:lipid-A-disaccharide synthase-like uncharacterized protein